MFKKIIVVLLATLGLHAGNITVAVAANVSYAIAPLQKAFNEISPDTKVRIILGGSGKLTAQIMHGAPYELFLSADLSYPQKLYKEGYALTPPRVYAKGSLALFSVKKRDFSNGITLLQEESIHKIAVANPKTAPYGIAAVEAMQKVGIYTKIKKKFVFAESISQTLSYAMQAADIGIVATSALYSPKMHSYVKGEHWKRVSEALYTPIKQGIVILKAGKDNPEVKAFYAFMLSKSAQEILQRYGYSLP